MSYFLRRIDRFLEHERSQGRNWKKRNENQLYYSVTGNSRYEYPVVWIAFHDLQCNDLTDIVYQTGSSMGCVLYHQGVWNQHNVVSITHNVRNMSVIINSIVESWR
ncbi:hypothetical protein Xbed_03426 [Xenorhabdus beddingii]|uniref:Uncharacterized protein n=1 Tax=Xenorhabdus beddingii TaxID=40578 RepID=A0A1Y2SGQ7_9GAMM|nr:hypothetical protein Xbed_03426 [Xenorhabdus beddingii]